MDEIRISEFVLFKKEGSDHYTGYANYFGVEKRSCIIKRVNEKYVVLVETSDGWMKIGLFYPKSPEIIRGAKDYRLVGLIWTPDHTYYLLEDGERFIGL